tara:strand:- start:274 stop:417 length:144 start_codon:yes stop_codon:yes gene_type:complete
MYFYPEFSVIEVVSYDKEDDKELNRYDSFRFDGYIVVIDAIYRLIQS